jgi:hypothetical protein
VRASDMRSAAMKHRRPSRQPFSRQPRRDGTALGFGLAFLAFGALWLLRTIGVDVRTAWLYPLILIGLGLAGLATLMLRERRQ